MDSVPTEQARSARVDAPARFEEFYLSAWSGAVGLAALLTQDASVAEELAQDAFVAVMSRWDELHEPASYLRRCIGNAAMMYHRRSGTARRNSPTLARDGVAVLGFDELADAVAALPFRQRAVLVLRYHVGCNEREIAEVLGCRPGTVKSLASRALSKLHKELS